MIRLAVLAGLFAFPAAAQTQCMSRADFVDLLEGQYGESLRSYGLEKRRGVVEIWTNRENGSWTIILTLPNGQSCHVGDGTNWEAALQSDASARDL